MGKGRKAFSISKNKVDRRRRLRRGTKKRLKRLFRHIYDVTFAVTPMRAEVLGNLGTPTFPIVRVVMRLRSNLQPEEWAQEVLVLPPCRHVPNGRLILLINHFVRYEGASLLSPNG